MQNVYLIMAHYKTGTLSGKAYPIGTAYQTLADAEATAAYLEAETNANPYHARVEMKVKTLILSPLLDSPL